MNERRIIGVDLASGPDKSVLAEVKNGKVVRFQEIMCGDCWLKHDTPICRCDNRGSDDE